MITPEKTLIAFILSIQLSIASGSTLLDEVKSSSALVPASQTRVREETVASKWWGLNSLWTTARNAVSSLLSPQKTVVTPSKSWEEVWDATYAHLRKMNMGHHSILIGADKIYNDPQLETDLINFVATLDDDEDIWDEKHSDADNLSLAQDFKKLKFKKGAASLIFEAAQDEKKPSNFATLLFHFYRNIKEKNKDLNDESFFTYGTLMAHCLFDITNMTKSEAEFSHFTKRVVKFYKAYDHGRLTDSSLETLETLGIPYSYIGSGPKRTRSSFSYSNAAKAGGIIFLTFGLGFLQGVNAGVPAPTEIATACRNSAIECLSAFGSPVGFNTQISHFTSNGIYNNIISDMQDTDLAFAYNDAFGDMGSNPDYMEISTWNNAVSPNVTRAFFSNTPDAKGCDYAPLSAIQHTESTFDNSPINKANIVTSTASGSINPYYWELINQGDMWFYMAQHPDGTIVGSTVFRPAVGNPFLQYYANLVMTPQTYAYRVDTTALQSAFVFSTTPNRVTTQQGITAANFEASYYKGLVNNNDCTALVTIQQFLSDNGINLSGLIQCMQQSGYNPLSCRTFGNPLGGYMELMSYYIMNTPSVTQLHEVVVNGPSYTHDIYVSTGPTTVSRTDHTFDWKSQSIPTTTTTSVAQSLSARQGTLTTSPLKYAVLYFNTADSNEPALVIKVDGNDAVSYGAYLGHANCPPTMMRRHYEREVPQEVQYEEVEETPVATEEYEVIGKKHAKVDIDDFEYREDTSLVEAIKSWFGFNRIIRPDPNLKPEQWYEFYRNAPKVDGRPLKGLTIYDGYKGLEHDFEFRIDGHRNFEITYVSKNITNAEEYSHHREIIAR